MDITDERGIYQPSKHIEFAAERTRRFGGDTDAFVKSHVRRLEALRRAGHALRIDEDHWQVPKDLPERGLAFDHARDGADKARQGPTACEGMTVPTESENILPS